MNLRTMALALVALVALGTSAVSYAQTGPGPQGTPPPPPVPSVTSTPLLSTSPEPTAAPSVEVPSGLPSTTPTPEPFTSPATGSVEAGSPSPSPSPAGRGHHGHGGSPSPGPSPTDTPEPPQFSTLDGVWEVAMQPLNGARTSYSHLYITQSGNTLTGTWRKDSKTTLPFTGTFDGRVFKLSVADGPSTLLLSGYEENYSDMVGLFTDGDPQHQGTPFTAAHRKKEHDRGVNIR